MITKSYKYRIYPSKKQKELIQKTFGCTRFVYNYFLDLRIKKYNEENELFNNTKCCRELTNLKKTLVWLKEPDKFALQNAIRDLDNAYQNFFKGIAGFPKFKSKKNHFKTYRTTWNHSSNGGNIKFLGKSIQLPKLGYVKIKDKRIPQGRILNAIISQEPNRHYYCSITCTEIEVSQYPKTNKNVGIDLGLVDFAILSDGIKIGNPRFYERSEKKLAKLQRELSRKTIGSNRYNKARIKVAKKLQKHIQNQRKDFLQKLTTDIVRHYDIICIEDLEIKELKETDSKKLRNKKDL